MEGCSSVYNLENFINILYDMVNCNLLKGYNVPTISVIIPAYNISNYINKCIFTLQNQTIKDIEFIFVNDGSTDDTGELLDKAAQTDHRIKVIHKQNGGVSSARNAGIDNASGLWIAFFDPDDILEKDIYEKLLDCAIKNNSKLAVCGFQTVDLSKNYGIKKLHNIQVISYQDALKNLISGSAFSQSLWNKIFHKSLFDSIRLDEDIHNSEDTLVLCRVITSYADIVAYTPDILYTYVKNEKGATIVFSDKRLTAVTALKRITDIVSNINSELEQLSIAYFYLYVSMLQVQAISGDRKDLISTLKKEIKPYFWGFFTNKNISFKNKLIGILIKISPKLAHLVWSKI